MTIRGRVLIYGVGVAVLGMALLGAHFVDRERRRAVQELGDDVAAFLDGLASQAIPTLSGNRIEELHEILATLSLGAALGTEGAALTVLARGRTVVAHTDHARFGQVLDDPFSLEATAALLPLSRRAQIGEHELLQVSRPLVTAVPGHPGIRWGTAIMIVPMDTITRTRTHLVMRIVLVIVVASLLAGAFIFVMLSRHLVRPIERLTQAAEALATGDLDVRAETNARDEIGALGTAFNDMAGRLQAFTQSLEQQVAARTLDLTQANARLSDITRALESTNTRLQEMATIDEMTGLRNFRYFSGALDRELRRSRRTGSPVSLLMIDVDHFKTYNDTHGHPAGDEVLRRLGEILRARLRGIDLPCRYGGEEFAVVLLDTPKERARDVAEELRRTVGEADFPGGAAQPGGRLTISVGVASSLPDADQAEALTKAADEALYRAKRAGRDRVIAYGDEGGS